MKTTLSILFCLFCMNCFGQSVIQEWPLSVVQKGVEVMEQKSPRGSVTRYFYDEDGLLIKQIYKNRGAIRTIKLIGYKKSDTSLIAKTDETLNYYEKAEKYDKSVRKFFFDDAGKYNRFEVFYNEKRAEPYVVGDNFVYEGDLLMSYDRNKYSRGNKTSTTQMVFKYNDKGQLVRVCYYEPNPKEDSFVLYNYNEQGQLSERIKIIPDYLGTLDVASLLGDDLRSDQKMSKRHTVYSDFDAHGNWTTSSTVLKDGKKKNGYKRKLTYSK